MQPRASVCHVQSLVVTACHAPRRRCPLQPPNVPVLTVQRMWLSNRQRNATDVSLVTQLSGTARDGSCCVCWLVWQLLDLPVAAPKG